MARTGRPHLLNSKAKGSAFELEIVKAFAREGVHAVKQPLSGALGGSFKGDIQVGGMLIECKRRARGSTYLYNAFEQGGGVDIVIVRDDRRPPIVCMKWDEGGAWASILRQLNWAQAYPIPGCDEPYQQE